MFESSPESYLVQVLAHLQGQIGRLEGQRVLDYGCGIGTLSRLMLGAGARAVEALEPDPNARAQVQEDLGMRVWADLAELRQDATEGYDLITMVEVVEHLRSPQQTLNELAGLLKPGGWAYLSTPNVASLKALLLGPRWENYGNPTHLYYFSQVSLARLLDSAGFATAAVWRPPITYPAHGAVMRTVHSGLKKFGLDGSLRMVART